MAVTRKQIVTGFSVLYLAALIVLAGYALHSSNKYSLPIPNIISALTIALPPLAGLALEAVLALNEKLAARGQLQTSRIFQLVIGSFLVFESVLATLAGTHISPPGSLTCALRETWEKLYRMKDGDSIRVIQDTFQCCGFNSVRDMAFPFPENSRHGANACVERYERNTACFEPWREEERKVAIMLLVVPVAVFVWKIAIVMSPSSQSSWLPSHMRLPIERSDGAAPRRPRLAVEYRDVEDQGEEDSVQRAVTGLNKDSQLATQIEGSRTKSSGLLSEANMWRQEDAREARG